MHQHLFIRLIKGDFTMNKNQLVRLVSFCLLITFLTLILGRVFYFAKSNMRERLYTYSTLKDGNVDAIFVGTSGVARFWIPGEAYNKYGVTVYPLSIDAVQCWHVLTLVKYGMEYQSPKLVLVDTRPFTVDEETKDCEYRSRYMVDALRTFSKFRVEASARAVHYLGKLGVENPFDITYYFNVLRYHDMWKDGMDFSVIRNKTSPYFGCNFTRKQSHAKVIGDTQFTEKRAPLTWFAQECLDELIEYCQENKLELIFVNSPHCENEATYERTNTLYDYLDEKGVEYVDFVSKEGEEKYPFNRNNEFYDSGHTNYWGSVKFTSYLSEYLIENHGLVDHRNEEGYEEWQDCYKATLKKAKKIGIYDANGVMVENWN